MEVFVGIDVGSLTTKTVAIDKDGKVVFSRYLRNDGGPIEAVQRSFGELANMAAEEYSGYLQVLGVGATGSGRRLAAIMTGADVIKNEITAHATAAGFVTPRVKTVIDIGGQDSKIIYLRNGIPVGFNMNTVCAAGTGSFLDHQAARLNLPVEEFGEYALRSRNSVRISGRCGVFAESDLIHKQQMGYRREDLIAGLCHALARNYVTNVARGRKIQPVALFQGGVAANIGIKKALEELLGLELVIPRYFKVMGALGSALLVRREAETRPLQTKYRGTSQIASFTCYPRGFTCEDCSNNCEINEFYIQEELVERWGGRCSRWEILQSVPV